MTEAEAMGCLRAAVANYGTDKVAAKALGVSPQYLSDVLNYRRNPGRVLERFGLMRVVTYEWRQE